MFASSPDVLRMVFLADPVVQQLVQAGPDVVADIEKDLADGGKQLPDIPLAYLAQVVWQAAPDRCPALLAPPLRWMLNELGAFVAQLATHWPFHSSTRDQGGSMHSVARLSAIVLLPLISSLTYGADIVGRATLNGIPQGAVDVTLAKATSPDTPAGTATSDEAGNFVFSGIAPGRYVLKCRAKQTKAFEVIAGANRRDCLL